MFKKIFIPFIIFIIASIFFNILGSINIIRINYNDNITQNDGIIESMPKFVVTYDRIEFYQEMNRYNRPVTLFKKIENEEETFPVKSDIKADIKSAQLKNKLKYINSYSIQYKSQYNIYPAQENIKKIKLIYKLPAKKTVIDDFKIYINNNDLKEIKIDSDNNEIISNIQFRQGEINNIEISYIAKGSSFWKYYIGKNINQLIEFNLELTTNFKKIIFPEDCISTAINNEIKNSTKLRWNYNNLLLGYNIGIEMPHLINPGKSASLMSFSGIICLLLFFIFLFFSLIYNNKEFSIYEYFFLTLSFFIFYLTFSFTIQYLNNYLSLIIALIVSLSISGFYISNKNGIGFTILYILIPQFVYTCLISFSLFYKGLFGLSLTIVIIATTVIIMIMNIKSIKIKQINHENSEKTF